MVRGASTICSFLLVKNSPLYRYAIICLSIYYRCTFQLFPGWGYYR